MIPDRLRLRAADAHDLLIMGSCVQDSLAPVVSMIFDKHDESFTVLLNRFMWEAAPEEGETPDDLHFYRTHSGLRFSNVKRVQFQGFSLKEHSKTLNLLSLQSEKKGEVTLVFSEEARVRLTIGLLEAFLFDVEDPWLSPVKPMHMASVLKKRADIKGRPHSSTQTIK